VMSHTSTNYDRSGFQRDWNVVFPLYRLRKWRDMVSSDVSLIFTTCSWEPTPFRRWRQPHAILRAC